MLAEADARSAASYYESQVRGWIATQAFNVSLGCILLSNEFIPKLDLPGLVANRQVISPTSEMCNVMQMIGVIRIMCCNACFF